MKKYSLIVIIGFFSIISCGEKLINKPDNLIPKDKMITILKDMAIINSAKKNNLVVLKENGIEPTDYLFKKHNIDSAQFVDSDRYYASLPLEYESIYVSVEEQLENEKIEMEAAKKITDSLELIDKDTKKDSKKIKNLQE